MVERHPYTVDTGVQFSNEVPKFSFSDSPNLVMALRLGRRIMRVQIPHRRPIYPSLFSIFNARCLSLSVKALSESTPFARLHLRQVTCKLL
jgi:hypothetical protein